MALSHKSKTYMSIKNDLATVLNQQGSITKDNLNEIGKAYGVTGDEIQSARQDEKKESIEGPSWSITDPAGKPSTVERLVSRGIGSVVEPLYQFGKTVVAEPVFGKENIDAVEQSVGEKIPEQVKKNLQGQFDPYHGEGVLAFLEEGTATVAPYFLGTGALVGGAKAIMGTRAAAPITSRFLNRLGTKGKTLGTAGAYGTAFATTSTLLEDPRENVFDVINGYIFQDPDALANLERITENPDDIEAADYLDAFIKNLGFEGVLAGGGYLSGSLIKALAKNYKAGKYVKTKQVVTKIGDTTRGVTSPAIQTLDKLTRKPREFVSRNFSSRMGTDDETLEATIKRDAAATAAAQRADGYAKDLQKAIEDQIKISYPQSRRWNNTELDAVVEQQLKDRFTDLINRYWAGDDLAGYSLSNSLPEIFDIAQSMRVEIDKLSSMLPVKGNLRATIDANLGIYMNRSYDIFDDPTYRKAIQERVLSRPENNKKIRDIQREKAAGRITNEEAEDLITNLTDDVVNNAAEYIARTSGKNVNDPIVQEMLEKLVRTEDKDAFSKFIESISVKNKLKSTSKPLLNRKDIDVSIRDLWGEVKDPAKNFVKTYEKLSVMNAENEFLETIARNLGVKFQNRIAKVMRENPTLSFNEAQKIAQEGLVDLTKAGNDRLSYVFGGAKLNSIDNPLQGIYAGENYARAIKQGMDVDLPDWANWWMKLKGTSQALKTVYYIPTHGKNIIGNVVMLLANGIVPTRKELYKAFKTNASQLSGLNNKELGERMAEYTELGITNSGIGLSIIRRNLNSILKDPESWVNKRAAGKVAKKFADVYQAEDDFFKIIHFEKTKDYLKKVYPTLSDQEIKRMAAQRTRDLMPNYNLVPRAVKYMRASPVGDFTAFPAEMLRTSKNLAKYTLDDTVQAMRKGSDESFNADELLKAAQLRLAGMSVAANVGDYIQDKSMALFGITDKQDRAINLTGAPFTVNQERIYTGPLQEDKNGHIVAPSVTLGSYDPYNIIKVMAQYAHAKFLSGEEYNDLEMNKISTGALEQVLQPFVGPSMITQALIDIATGKGIDVGKEDTVMGYLKNAAKTIGLDLLDPGYLKFIQRRLDYENSGMTDYGSSISPGDVDAFAFFGFRRPNIDISNSMRFNMFPILGDIKRADSKLKRIIDNPNATSDEIYDSWKDIQKQRIQSFKNLRSMIQLYKDMGYSIEGIIDDIRLGGRKTEFTPKDIDLLRSADQNIYVPSYPSVTTSKGPVADIPFDRINRAFQILNGKELE